MKMVSLLFVLLLPNVIYANNFWQQVNAPYNGDVRSITFTNSGVMIAGTYGGGVWRSTNDGQSWSMSNSGITYYYAHALATSPDGWIFAGVSSGIFRSTDEGVNWQAVIPSCECEFRSLAISRAPQSSGTIFVGTTSGVSRSTDNGANWSAFALSNVAPIVAVAVDSNGIVYATSTTYGIYRSTDNGATWLQTSLTSGTFSSIAINSSGHVFAATYANVYRSLDSGATWQQVVIASADVRSVAVALNGDIFAALNPGGVYRSTNNGTVWDSVNSGLTNRYGTLLAVNPAGYLFAVVGARLFRSTQLITAVELPSVHLPTSASLEQNFPNPFNPTTEFGFRIGEFGLVTLKVYSMLGQEVVTLVNELKQPGTYTAAWDASDFPSGVYFYRLQGGSYVETKKAILLR
jgi:photosystem II stability/assembly factor-like uncharacterized protein